MYVPKEANNCEFQCFLPHFRLSLFHSREWWSFVRKIIAFMDLLPLKTGRNDQYCCSFELGKMSIFNSLLKITNNDTLLFTITNHMIIYKTTFKSYMQYIIIQLYTYFKKCFLFLMCR